MVTKGPQCCLQGTPRRDFSAISTCRKHSDCLGQEPLTGKAQSTGLAAGVGEEEEEGSEGAGKAAEESGVQVSLERRAVVT